MTIQAYSTTAASNTSINGVNIDEGMAPSDVNNAMRNILADIKTGLITLAKSGAYTIVEADLGKLVVCDTTGAGFTVTLLAAATAGDGFLIGLKNIGTNTLTIDGDGAETIDGATTKTITNQYGALILRCDGTEWHAESEFAILGTAANADTGNDAAAELPTNAAFAREADATGTYTVVAADNHKLKDIGGTTPTVTLPQGSTLFNGFEVIIKSNTSDDVTINRSGSDTIDGETSIVLSASNDFLWLRNNGGTIWSIVSQNKPGVRQIVQTTYATATSTASNIPADDTIPQNTEGLEIMTRAITPQKTTNILIIDILVNLAATNTGQLTAALFQDSTADAIYVASNNRDVNGPQQILCSYQMAAGTTSSTTFKVRVGHSSVTCYVNQATTGRFFRGIQHSYIRITEYEV